MILLRGRKTMWPFSKGRKSWEPKYVDERYLVPRLHGSRVAIPVGETKSNWATDQIDALPHKDAGVVDFGHDVLPMPLCGRYGLESLYGLFSIIHWPGYCDHWWCTREIPITMISEIYFAHTVDNQPYIGAFLWEVESATEEGSGYVELASAERPTTKLILQPCSDGSVQITKGLVDHTSVSGSAGNQGTIDQSTAEHFRVFPRRISLPLAEQYPEDYQGWPTFHLMRRESLWHVGVGYQLGETKWAFWYTGQFPGLVS